MSQTRPTQYKPQQHGLNILNIFHCKIFSNITVSGCSVRTVVGGDEGGDPAGLVGTDLRLGEVEHHLLLRHLEITQHITTTLSLPSSQRAPLLLVEECRGFALVGWMID